MPFSASSTAQHGAAAGIAQADRGNVSAANRNQNLLNAGQRLAELRLYAEAANILSAGVQGGSDAPATARQIELYRGIHSNALAPLPADNPARPVQAINFSLLTGTATRESLRMNTSRQGFASSTSLEHDIDRTLLTNGTVHQRADSSGSQESVLLDTITGTTTFTSKGDDAHGYSVLIQEPGEQPQHAFVVREDGVYRAVAFGGNLDCVGNAVLFALAHNNPGQAKALLDWKRDLTHKSGDDDDLAGPLLPRFWTVDSSRPDADSPAAMRLAAISLLVGVSDVKPYLPEISDADAKATGQRQTDLDLLLATAAVFGAEQPAFALPAAKRLLDQYPDSLTALNLLGRAYALQGDAVTWQAMLAPRLEKRPQDRNLLSQQARACSTAHDFAAARAAEQKVIDSGKATAEDYNSISWLGLFDNHLGEDTTKAAQQANMLTKNADFASLHTLACIYAAQGHTSEARQVLKQALSAADQTTPDSPIWYVLGLVYEQYGARAAALDAYGKVQAHEFDDRTYIDPVDTYNLTQQRIKILNSATP